MSRIISGKLRLDVQPRRRRRRSSRPRSTRSRPPPRPRGSGSSRRVDPRAGPVTGDPGRLQQVVWNLLTNAVKFTPARRHGAGVLQRVNSHVEISVTDTGEGIEPEFLPHVFDRFRQADASTTRRHGGLGLGLAIVKQLVELHGGTVRADSPGEGRGATFTVTLPLTARPRRGQTDEVG